MSLPANQNINHQLQRPQNTGNFQRISNTGNFQRAPNTGNFQRVLNIVNFQRAPNTGRQAPGHQNNQNLFTDTLNAVQKYNELVEGSSSFVRTEDVEIPPQSTQFSMYLGFSFT
ncbi:hypothetical protein F8M41_018061 [Gigaspora margarita]|uniref:Uncharacterized protein n=1 Tax=Gigaspora margarita TaxID=4874 RepID=A0A8H4AM89_GIGMA|nr:hypothetical protein F8M41_018061 [Gigaspora margarita]